MIPPELVTTAIALGLLTVAAVINEVVAYRSQKPRQASDAPTNRQVAEAMTDQCFRNLHEMDAQDAELLSIAIAELEGGR